MFKIAETGFRSRARVLAGAAALAIIAASAGVGISHVANTKTKARMAGSAPKTAMGSAAISNLPLSFEPNVGQTDPTVKYVARADGYTAYLTDKQVVVASRAKNHDAQARITFAANSTVKAEVTGERTGTTNYYVGPKSAWRTNVPDYGGVRYHDAYPGVDVVFRGDKTNLRSTM